MSEGHWMIAFQGKPMQNQIRLLFSVFFLTISLSGLWSQQSVHSSGGNASGASGTVSYSIGQVAYTSAISDAGQVNQGVQQGNPVIMVGQTDPVSDFTIGFYPNPVHNDALLSLGDGKDDLTVSGFSFLLFSIYGTLIMEKEISHRTTPVPMNQLPDGVYLLKVARDNMTINTFKVVKTN